MGQWWIDEPGVLGSGNPTDDELERLFKEGKLVEMIEEVVSKAKDLIKEERLKYSPK